MSRPGLRLAHGAQQKVEFFWNGRALQGRVGEHVAAALLANGIRTLAWSRKSHRPMGLSGNYVNGVLARVDGLPNVRLDQVQVRAGMQRRLRCAASGALDSLGLDSGRLRTHQSDSQRQPAVPVLGSLTGLSCGCGAAG
jgi:hypothetical protein